jgi:T4 RnlA family RNA ligase
MLIDKFLQDNKNDWQEKLSNAPYYIKIVEDNDFYLLKYDLVMSDLSLPLVQECRGIIFDKNLQCVCRPFDKFFNVQESLAAEIDWASAQVQEKIDGSLMKIWYYDNEWHLSTNGIIDAFKSNTPIGYSFGDLFLKAVNVTNLSTFCENFDKDYTYCFELTSPYNIVVIEYDFGVYFLLKRNTKTGEPFVGNVNIKNIKYPKIYPLNSLDQCLKLAKEMGPDEEGYVVVDKNNHRIKIKSAGWLTAHYLAHNNIITPSYLIKIIRDNTVDDFKAYCGRYTNELEEVQNAIKRLGEECEKTFQQYKHLASDRKKYALAVTQTKYKDYCFWKLKNPEKSVNDYINFLTINKLKEKIDDFIHFTERNDKSFKRK